MAEPPEVPCPALSSFLSSVAQTHPKAFFKPLFTCAASSKDLTIANQLCILNLLARYIPEFWIKDAEMVSVALMSEPAPNKSGSAPKPRLGQMVLLIELIDHLRTIRAAKDLAMVSFGNSDVRP